MAGRRSYLAGQRSYLAGLAAEEQVASHYTRMGRAVCARRWRGQGGEIDLVARDGGELVFIEVKQSRTHHDAAMHLTDGQMRRIWNTANEYLAGEPTGLMTQMRFDIALVDGLGRIEVIENAYAA